MPLHRAARFAATVVALGCLASSPLASAQSPPAVAVVVPTLGGAPWTPDGIAKLDADLDALLADGSALRGAHVGVVALDTATGATLYARDADDEFQPASTLKLLVGSAALERLGPEFAFRTAVRTVPLGDVDAIEYVAGGDPFLTIDDLATAARAVASGPRGDAWHARPKRAIVDASHFDDRPYPDGWTWDDFGQAYAPRVSAADVDEGLVHLVVTPAANVGGAAVVRSRSVAEIRSGPPAACAARRDGLPVAISRATTLVPGAEDTLDIAPGPGGCIEVVGGIPQGAQPESIDAAVPDPVGYLRQAANATLRSAGLVLASGAVGEAAAGTLAEGPGTPLALWSHASPPLAAFLGPRFWIPSDNLVGEVLLEELGFATDGKPGTTAKGVAFEKLWLRSIGVDPATVTLADGCGMSQYDRITPRDLAAILQHDWNGPNRQLVLDSLPIGGARGTIEGIAGTPVVGRVFAKTGSMKHVRGLAGYVATVRHGAVTFAFNVDDWNGAYPALAAVRAAVLARIATD